MGKAAHSTRHGARLWAWLGDLPHWLAHHFQEDSRATLFSAALAVIATHVGALWILVKLSLMIVANMAAQATPVLDGGGPVVLLLSETRWQDRYFEHSPLDRCILADDLGQILVRTPRNLAVDFDLSPSLRPEDAACQDRLDALLDRHAATLVLLSPFRVSAPRLIAQKRAWMLARCQAGAAFADGSLEISLGMVLDAVPGPDRMAEVVGRRNAAGICAAIATDAGSRRWLARDDDASATDPSADVARVRNKPSQAVTLNPGTGSAAATAAATVPMAEADDAAEAPEPVAINFVYFRSQAAKLSLDDLPTSPAGDWRRRDVFFGGDYGAVREDQFSTPIGPLPGIAVHAARFLTLERPVAELRPLAGFVTDVLIAFIFSIGIGYFWSRYAKLRLAQRPSHRQLASGVVLLFLLFYLALAMLFFLLSTDLFAVGILIVPLLIAVSMLVDGFITGPLAAIPKQVGSAPDIAPPAGDFVALLLTIVFIAIVVPWLHVRPLTPSLAGVLLVMSAILFDRVMSVQATRIIMLRRRRASAQGHVHHHAPGAGWVALAILGFGVAGAVLAARMTGMTFRYLITPFFFTLLVCISLMMLGGLLIQAFSFFRPRAPRAPLHAREAVAADNVPGSAHASHVIVQDAVSPASTATISILATTLAFTSLGAGNTLHRSHRHRAGWRLRLLGIRSDAPAHWLDNPAAIVYLVRKFIFWATLSSALAFLLHS